MSSFFRTLFFSKIPKSITVHYSASRLLKENCLSRGTSFAASKRTFSSENVSQNEASRINKCKVNNYVQFDEMITSRRAESKRTVLVQVQSESSVSELYNYCNQFGIIKTVYYYSMDQTHFILVEFSEESSVKAVLEHGTHLEKEQIVPVKSPLLWFRAGNKSKKKIMADSSPTPVPYSAQKLCLPEKNEFVNMLMQAESASDQIMMLYLHSKLNDVGSRLRFLTARQVELMLSGVFPHIQVLPFGSSVNSYGKMGCDLDLVILLNDLKERKDSRLIFQAKTSLNNGRAQIQRQMETFADLMQLLLPGCSQVKKILQARVPIIKYNQDLTFVECDLSMTNLTAVYMSELLYLLGYIDWRVRPLVFSIRWWAQEVMLTNPANPGRWITNFSLTLLVIFFLQRVNVLPSLDALIKVSGSEDVRISDDGVNCTFLRDLSKLPTLEPKNSSSLVKLMSDFFEFYSTFDFFTKAISLNSGDSLAKPEFSAMYIVNPLEKLLNVSKNVSLEETERFKIEARNAAYYLDPNAIFEEADKTKPWGLLELFKDPKETLKMQQAAFRDHLRTPLKHENRLVSVEDLFSDIDDNGIDTISQSSSKSKKVKQSKSNKSAFAKRR